MNRLRLVLSLLVISAACADSDAKGSERGIRQEAKVDGEETFVFFIPEDPNKREFAYIFDSERNHLLVCSAGDSVVPAGVSKTRNTDEWVVLPGNVRAYSAPSLNSRVSDVELSYPEKIESLSEDTLRANSNEWIAFRNNGIVFYLPVPLLARRAVLPDGDDGNLPVGHEAVDRYRSLPPDYEPNDLVKVSQRWNFHDVSNSKYLRAEVARVIEEMLDFAHRQGIHIRIFSAYRSFAKQRFLYLRKINKEGLNQILVAKPGQSEHQLGTAVDLCGLDPESVANAEFGLTRQGKWLRKYGPQYGFIQSYREDNREETGYAPEPWHYRYMGEP